MSDELGVVVFSAQGEIEEQQICSFLAAHDITAWARGEALRRTHGLTLDGIGQVDILVAKDDEAAARELLDEAERGGFALDEDFQD